MKNSKNFNIRRISGDLEKIRKNRFNPSSRYFEGILGKFAIISNLEWILTDLVSEIQDKGTTVPRVRKEGKINYGIFVMKRYAFAKA